MQSHRVPKPSKGVEFGPLADNRDFQARVITTLSQRGRGWQGEGDRAAILALNSDRYFEFFYATAWAGGVFVPINIRLAPPEIRHWLNDSEAKILFIDAQFAPVLAALEGQIPHVREIVFLGDDSPPDGLHAFEHILAAATP